MLAHRVAEQRVHLRLGPDVEAAFLALAVGILGRGERGAAARAPPSCRAPSSRRFPRRAPHTAGPADARAPAPAAPATVRCRTASSRSAAPARWRRWNSGNSRRRDGRRCRPATCARSIRCSASCPAGAPVRNAFCHRKRKIGGIGEFRRAAQPAMLRIVHAAAAPPPPHRDAPASADRRDGRRTCASSTWRSAAVFFVTISWSVRMPPTRLAAPGGTTAAPSAAPAGNTCRPRTARRRGR